MSIYWKIAQLGIIAGVFGYFAACSPVEFAKEPAARPSICSAPGVACVQTCDQNGQCSARKITVDRTVGRGVADILIVDDNSGSMSTEQAQMGLKFPRLLDALGNLDYRIGIVTTDVSGVAAGPGVPTQAREANGIGAFRDGTLLNFGSNMPFLPRPPTAAVRSQYEQMFLNTVKRQETIDCENSGYQANFCPSGDERGIYAVSLFLQKSGSTFLRNGASFDVVFLTDEDERSDRSNPDIVRLFPLQERDRGSYVLSQVNQAFEGKATKAHSIIIDDEGCRQAQSNQGGNGFITGSFGTIYKEFSQLTNGYVGSICSPDYGVVLDEIGKRIAPAAQAVDLVCTNPVGGAAGVKVYLKNGSARSEAPAWAYGIDISRRIVEFRTGLAAETQLAVEWECPATPN